MGLLAALLALAAPAATSATAAAAAAPHWAEGNYLGTVTFGSFKLFATGNFRGNVVIIDVFGTELAANVTWDEANGAVDLRWTSSSGFVERNTTALGIYRREGPQLWLAVGVSLASGRPVDFEVRETSIIIVLSPVDAAANCPRLDAAPPLSTLPEGKWRVLRPGGDTQCGDGTPFAFFVRRGASGGAGRNVVIEFQGGGACWNKERCAGAPFLGISDGLAAIDCHSFAPPSQLGQPVAGNPTTDYTYVWVPYCTQDIHAGDVHRDYGGGVTTRHYGYRNSRAVLKWVFANLPEPEVAVVTGCSAGGYGAILYAPYVMQHYKPKGTRVPVLVDSAVGVVTASFMREGFGNWRAACAMQGADFLNGRGRLAHADGLVGQPLDPFAPSMRTRELMQIVLLRTAAAFPSQPYGLFTTLHDGVQGGFFRLMGGASTSDWTGHMLDMYGRVDGAGPVRALVVDGTKHCPAMDASQYEWAFALVKARSASELPASSWCAACSVAKTRGCDGVMGSGKVLDDCGVCVDGGASFAAHVAPTKLADTHVSCYAALPLLHPTTPAMCSVDVDFFPPRCYQQRQLEPIVAAAGPDDAASSEWDAGARDSCSGASTVTAGRGAPAMLRAQVAARVLGVAAAVASCARMCTGW